MRFENLFYRLTPRRPFRIDAPPPLPSPPLLSPLEMSDVVLPWNVSHVMVISIGLALWKLVHGLIIFFFFTRPNTVFLYCSFTNALFRRNTCAKLLISTAVGWPDAEYQIDHDPLRNASSEGSLRLFYTFRWVFTRLKMLFVIVGNGRRNVSIKFWFTVINLILLTSVYK